MNSLVSSENFGVRKQVQKKKNKRIIVLNNAMLIEDKKVQRPPIEREVPQKVKEVFKKWTSQLDKKLFTKNKSGFVANVPIGVSKFLLKRLTRIDGPNSKFFTLTFRNPLNDNEFLHINIHCDVLEAGEILSRTFNMHLRLKEKKQAGHLLRAIPVMNLYESNDAETVMDLAILEFKAPVKFNVINGAMIATYTSNIRSGILLLADESTIVESTLDVESDDPLPPKLWKYTKGMFRLEGRNKVIPVD